MVFPQYGEVIWNKTHRYFGEQLDGIYIALNGLLKAVKTLKKIYKKWVERQIEKRKTGWKVARANSGEMSDANSKIPTPTPLLRLFSQPQFLNRNFFFNLQSPPLTHHHWWSIGGQVRRATASVIFPLLLQGHRDL